MSDIIVHELKPDPYSIDLIFRALLSTTFMFSDEEKNYNKIYGLVRNFERGINNFWLIADGDTEVGLFHGHLMDDYQFQGHQMFFKNLWGSDNWMKQEEAIHTTCGIIFNKFPQIKHIIGYTPVKLKHAIRAAKRWGFHQIGVYEDYYTYDDKLTDAAIMILKREDI